MKMGRRNGSSFTLLELLVVIAIVAFTAAMLLPTLARSVEASGKEECMNNLKQLGQAFKTYAQDYGGWLPHFDLASNNYGKDMGFQLVSPYLGKQGIKEAFGRDYMRCPSKPEVDAHFTYGMNYHSVFSYGDIDTISAGSPRMEKVPSSVFLVGDATTQGIYNPLIWPLDTDTDADGINDSAGALGEMQYNSLSPIHDGGANFLFGDMHTSWVSLNAWLADENAIWGVADAAAYR